MRTLRTIAANGKPWLAVRYETLAAQSESCMQQIGRFLGIDITSTSTDLVKTEQRPLSEAVINYAEARACADEAASRELVNRS